MVCFMQVLVHLGVFILVCCFWFGGLASGRQGNPICTDDFSV